MLARSRSLLAAGLAGALTSTALIGAATSSVAVVDKANVNVTIHLTDDGSRLVGKVKSPRDGCTTGRQVNLFGKPPGEEDYSKVADDNSNGSGRWSIPAPGAVIPDGKYYVKIADSNRCQAARSETIRVSIPT